MELNNTDNLNIESQFMLVNPEQLKASMPVSESGAKTVSDSRRVIKNILEKKITALLLLLVLALSMMWNRHLSMQKA